MNLFTDYEGFKTNDIVGATFLCHPPPLHVTPYALAGDQWCELNAMSSLLEHC